MTDEAVWFYADGDAQVGPVTISVLRDRLRNLPPTTSVWREGMAGWQAASSVSELAAHRPPPLRTHPSAPPDPDAGTLNPFILLRRSFTFSGRLDRGQFAVVYASLVAIYIATIMAVAATAAIFEKSSTQAPVAIAGLGMMVAILVLLVAQVSAVIRRLNDIGQSGWLALLLMVPCLNLMFVIYLLATPGNAGGAAPSGGISPVVAVVIAAALLVPVIGIIAAIAIPSLLRARVSANESATIGDLRTLVAAQAGYSTVNGGLYESRWPCLSTPATCIPGYSGAAFVDPGVLAEQKTGYRREFHPSSPASGAGSTAGASPSSVSGYAVVAYPITRNTTGVRSFCADDTGVICTSRDGRTDLVEPSGSDGVVRCAAHCVPLR